MNRKCPICGGAFEEGVMADTTYGGHVKAKWTSIIKMGGEYKVTKTFRCKNCGYLESYAK